MAFTFDHAAQLVNVTTPTTAVDIQALLNLIRDEEASERGITYPAICQATGKDSLGGAIYTGITLLLYSWWQMSFYAGNYTATIDGGNLVAASNDPIAYTLGGPQIEITRSAAATIAETGVSGLTGAESALLNDISTIVAATDTLEAAIAAVPSVIDAALMSDGLTYAQAKIVNNAILHGKVTGAGTATESFWSVNQASVLVERARITVDASGNRTAVAFINVDP